jgi:23S rRNA pseudouridine1911/1915/1917 synthase
METSGLLLASRHKDAERFLKGSFEKKEIQKEYLAWVRGEIKERFMVEEPIAIRNDYSTNKHKVEISQNGKYAKTEFKPIYYNRELDTTLIECRPITGRTHQIRIHLFHVKHPIVGDPIYGASFNTSNRYLEGKLSNQERIIETGATRLMLHANTLKFSYGCYFHITSNINFYAKMSI